MFKLPEDLKFPGAHAFCAAIAQNETPLAASVDADLAREELRKFQEECAERRFRGAFAASL